MDSPTKGRTARLGVDTAVVGGLVLLIALLLLFTAYDGCGRARAADCANDAVLLSPGTWNKKWCINVEASSGYMDGNDQWQDTSGLVPARCFTDEAEARNACETWVRP